jgi:hypothetical protein
MLANAEGVDADLVGEHALVDDIADGLHVGQRLAVGAGGDVAKGIQSEFKSLCHTFQCVGAPAIADR